MGEAWLDDVFVVRLHRCAAGVPLHTHVDREAGAWANARALHAMGFQEGETVFMMTGYGPHVWAWGVQFALAKMGVLAAARSHRFYKWMAVGG